MRTRGQPERAQGGFQSLVKRSPPLSHSAPPSLEDSAGASIPPTTQTACLTRTPPHRPYLYSDTPQCVRTLIKLKQTPPKTRLIPHFHLLPTGSEKGRNLEFKSLKNLHVCGTPDSWELSKVVTRNLFNISERTKKSLHFSQRTQQTKLSHHVMWGTLYQPPVESSP